MNSIIGAVLAAAISFCTALLALFVDNEMLTFSAISQATWVVVVGGVVVQFLKDWQAISARRLINRVTKTGDGGGQV